MKSQPFSLCLFFISILLIQNVNAQTISFTLSGFVTDATTGEALVGNNILVYDDTRDPELVEYAFTASDIQNYPYITGN